MLARLMCAASLLALAACTDQQTAVAPPAPPPVPPPAATTPPPTPPPVATVPPATVPPTTGTVTGTTPPVTGAGGVTAPSLSAFQGTTYNAGPVSLLLRPDNTFEMRATQGNQVVQGTYAYKDGVISFTNPKGDIGGATFPMQCRLNPTSAGFQLADAGGNCTYFRDLSFKR